MLSFMKRQLRSTLGIIRDFRGNARACVFTEPMWGIPYHLYITYASLYMVALGCSAEQIGIVTTVGLVSAMVFSLFGGYVTDLLGRKRTTLIFDLISWSIPTLLWAFARSFTWFVAAAAVNGVVRIVYTSWTCLFVEDTTPDQRIFAYTWIYVAGILAGFVAPVAGALVRRFSLVATMRGLYLFAFASMTGMFILRNHFSRETEIGLQRMRQTRGAPPREILRDYLAAALTCVKGRGLALALALTILSTMIETIVSAFLAILLTGSVGLSQSTIAIFPAVYSAVMLGVYLFLMPTLGRLDPSRPLFLGLAGSLAGYALLLGAPRGTVGLIVISTVLRGLGHAVTNPILSSLVANSIPDSERAKVMSLFYVLLFAVSSPSGYVAGRLAAVSDRLPFAVIVGLATLSIALAIARNTLARDRSAGASV